MHISPRDFPIEEVVKQIKERAEYCLELGVPFEFHQKWTCQHCSSRQTMDDANKLFRSGKCEECGQITIIEKCNYLMILGRGTSNALVYGDLEEGKREEEKP